MGQYFKAMNVTKKEVVDAWSLGGVAKMWEWCVNKWAGIFPFLLRKSTGGGGGDIREDYEYAGRWAGDEVYLVGDYDDSDLYSAEDYTNISLALAVEYNHFVELEQYQLQATPRSEDEKYAAPKTIN